MVLTGGAGRRRLLALFLVSMASVGFEIALTRYFAVAKWSEYGYWVISIVLAGFALSGVCMALARPFLARHGDTILSWLPACLILAATAGYRLVTTNPFNPLLLQNSATLWPQLALIGRYYACLLPFFFLAGLFVSLSFVLGRDRPGRVYGFDLTGAGAGALLALCLMWLVHPFRLVACLLPVLALAAPLGLRRRRLVSVAAALALTAGEAVLLGDDQAKFNDFKAIYAPLQTPDNHLLAQVYSPRGLYTLLDDFTEHVDTDISNDSGQLGLPGPPAALGLYRDGNRIAALAKPGRVDGGYAAATLASLPYMLAANPRVLLGGASGGFRVAEALALGATQVDVSEPEPVLRSALAQGLGGAAALAADPRVRVSPDGPLTLTRTAAEDGPAYDLVDISGDFLEAAPANGTAFTAEALASALAAVGPSGLVSIPVSIREFPAYAGRMLATLREAYRLRGIADPTLRVLVYRSAWNVRILASASPLSPELIAAARDWCAARSFDVSYYPGIDVEAARASIYNDLPAVSFDAAAVTSSGGEAHDAIADEAGAILRGEATVSARAFDLSPVTLDRPTLQAVLRLSDMATILRRLELLPQAEVGPLVNLAVLAQAAGIAVVVLLVPPLAGAGLRGPIGRTLAAVTYFAALGLGFLFIEIVAIERASVYLGDRTSGFALVLTGMLIFSGLGALLADRLAGRPRAALVAAVVVVLGWGVAVLVLAWAAMLSTLSWPWFGRAALVLAAVAPVSMALGLPFPLGLARVESFGSGFLPWAWGINGAFSVVATPLANLLAQQYGFDRVLIAALLLYVVAGASFPVARTSIWTAPLAV